MARKTQTLVQIIDDFDGQPIPEDQAEEVMIGWKGVNYRLDLSAANARKLEELLGPWISAGQKIGGGRGRPRGTGKRPDTGSGRSKEELAAIRHWLKQNGHEVNDRGRIKADLLEAFDKAHEG